MMPLSIFKVKLVLSALALFLLVSGAGRVVAAAELVLFETEGCEWCEQWNENIGVIYAKTAEGKFAPLRRVEIANEPPSDLKHLRAPASFRFPDTQRVWIQVRYTMRNSRRPIHAQVRQPIRVRQDRS